MHEPTILAGLSVVFDKSSQALDSIEFQKSAAPSARIEPEICLILRARGSRVIDLCKRDKISLAGDGELLVVFVFGRLFSVDRALARIGTSLEQVLVI